MNSVKQQYDEAIAQLTSAGNLFETVAVEVDGYEYLAYGSAPDSVTELISGGRQYNDQTFLVYNEERISFDAFFNQVDKIAFVLKEQYNILPGERVALALRNYPEWMSLFLAIVQIGAVAVPLNSWGQAQELSYGLQDAQASLVCCDEERLKILKQFLKESRLACIVVRGVAHDDLSACLELDELLESLPDGVESSMLDIKPDDTAMIMYTSGTTGQPKGAVMTHRNIANAVINFECMMMANAMVSGELIGAAMQKGYSQAALLAVPLFHVSGCLSQFIPSLRMGRKLVLLHKWNAEVALELIEKERVTSFGGVSNMIQEMLSSPDFKRRDLDSLFGLGGGGGAQPSGLEGLIESKLPGALAGTGWGLTESTATGTSSTGLTYKRFPSSAGIPAPIVEIDVRDEAGKSVSDGEVGELWIKSVTNIKEYWGKPEASKETLNDGWLRTGDLGYLNNENYLFIEGRKKEVIIRSGENIYPVEIELCIGSMDSVVEAAVLGVPDEEFGELVVAVVSVKPGQTLTKRDVQDFVRSRLAGFKVPSKVHVQQEPLARNATGKLLKQTIAKQLSTKKPELALET